MIELSQTKQLVITGAGGWLGRELLERLLAAHGSAAVQSFVHCLGSNARALQLSDGTEVQIKLLSEAHDFQNIHGFVHLAFLTRDKVSTYGTKDFAFQNLQITSQAIKLIEKFKPNFIATVSSGAVFTQPGGPLENDVDANPYGFTKRIEETMLASVADSLGANLAVGRLWGAIGDFMPLKRAYAVSDFIWQAQTQGKININSKGLVYRRYCSAGQFMDVLVTAAQEFERTSFDSGGFKIEMQDVAQTIANEIGQVQVSRQRDSSLPADEYFPDVTAYDELVTKLSIEPVDFESAIKRTIKFQLAQL